MLEGQEHLKRIQEQLKASEEERKVYERMLKQERVMYQQLLAEKEHITNQLIEFTSESEAKLNEKRNICEDLRHKNSVLQICLLYTSPSPRDATLSRMPSSA